MTARSILTADEMRAAEAAAIASGTSEEILMERAGAAAAQAIWRYSGPRPTLIACGPGNNGGDGYVIARHLRERGVAVRVAALSEPRKGAAASARARWTGKVEPLLEASGAAVLVDALFGTGLTRPLARDVNRSLARLAEQAAIRIAIDLPSGASTDDGSLLSPVPDYDLTITFATRKPSHLLQPAARHVGRLVIADIGIADPAGRYSLIAAPDLPAPGPDDHKYRRGYVAVVAGTMPGAAALSASAAIRAGAGYVRILAPAILADVPKAIVQGNASMTLLDDDRIGVAVIGPGLGRDAEALERLDSVLATGRRLVLDADALVLLAENPDRIVKAKGSILTPHAGEFAGLFSDISGSKPERARAAAIWSGTIVLFKGPDTVVAAPDGRTAIAPAAPAWLASAGTGDVLAGIVAAMVARGFEPFEAACAAVWIHGRAAEKAGPGLIADDLVTVLSSVVASCR